MAQVLCISSFIARGHVGLSAIIPALQGLGHETIALPTVLLSNHPGHPQFAKHEVPAASLIEMVSVYEQAGWLENVAAVLTGYLPTADHVLAAACVIDRVRHARPTVLAVCDPVLGDDPDGLYIADEAASTLKDRLVSIADVITPNRFELEWLSGHPVHSQQQAIVSARRLNVPITLVTSLPLGTATLGNLLVEPEKHALTTVPRLPAVPHGSGDFIAALFTGHILNGCSPGEALQLASAGARAVAERSQGQAELRIVDHPSVWINPVN